MATMSQLMVNLSLDMRDFNRQLDEAGGRMRDFGSSMQDIGKSMTSSISVPLMAVGIGAMKVANDFQSSQGKLQASLGLTEEQAKAMNGTVKNLWKEGFGESVDEVAVGISNVSKNLEGITGKELENATESAFILGKTFEADLNESSRSAGQLMKDFGVDSTKAFDMLTWGFQNGLDYSGEFLDTVREYSPQFSEMGYSGEQMMNTLKAGFDAGAWSLDKVGDSIKESHLRMGDMSKATQDAYSTLGFSAEEYAGKISKGGEEGNKAFQEIVGALMDVEDETVRNQLATDLFGTTYEDLREDVIFAMAGASDSIEGLEGTTKRAGDAIQDNFGERLKKVWRELQVALEPVGIVLIDLAERVLPVLSKAIQGAIDWFSGLGDGGQKAVVIFGLVMAIVPPLIVGLGILVSSIGSIVGAFGSIVGAGGKIISVMSRVTGAMNFARILPLLTSPIGIAIAVIGGLIAIGVLIWKNWDTIKAKAIEIWGAISSWFSEVWTSISSYASEVWDGIVQYFSDTWTSIVDGITGFIESVKTFFSDAWTSIKETAVGIFNALKDFFIEWVLGLLAWTPIGLFVGFIIENWETIKQTTVIIFDMIKAIIQAIFNAIMSVITPIVEGIKNFISKAWTSIKDTTTKIFNAVKDFFTKVWKAIVSFFEPIIESIVKFLAQRWENLKNNTTKIFNMVKDFLTEVWTNIWNKITSIASSIWNTLSTWFTSIYNTVSGIVTNVWTSVSTTFTNMYNKVKDVATNIYSKVKEKFDAVKKAITDPVKEAKEKISGFIDDIKGFFSNLKLTIPKPKFPKISVTKGTKSFFGSDIPYPKFDISWNAKGNIFNGASLLGGGQGVGEAGAEVVMPIQHSRYMKPFSSSVADHLDDMLVDNGGSIVNQFNVSELVVREEADVERIAQKLYDMQQRNKRQGGRR